MIDTIEERALKKAIAERKKKWERKPDRTNYERKWLCRKCIYRTSALSCLSSIKYDHALKKHGVRRRQGEVLYACGYLYLTDHACIGPDGVDKRGKDPAACNLYEEGPALERKRNLVMAEIPEAERYDRDSHFIN